MALIAVAIKIFSLSSAAVENYYSTGIYPYISAAQRFVLGWIPFSVGDFFYIFAGIYLLYNLTRLIKRVVRRRADGAYLKNVGLNLLTGVLAVYVVFNFLWGLNYNRRGIDFQLGLNNLEYSDEDLVKVTGLVVEKMNALQPSSERTRAPLKKKSHLFKGAIDAYKQLSKESTIAYPYPSVKPSIFSYLGNYLGFTGYYNPFSGEAQVNTTTPLFIRPFTTCHEIGHQLGYAKESEANFAGYLSAAASKDSSFLYAVYFEMFAYSARYLYYADSAALKQLTGQLSQGVKDDIKELRQFYTSYKNPVETAIDRLYSQYLKANEQPTGKMSYSEVVAMLIAYYKKNGRI